MTYKNLGRIGAGVIIGVALCLHALNSWTVGDDLAEPPTPALTPEKSLSDRPPKTFTILIPNYRDPSPKQPWREKSRYVGHELNCILDEFLAKVLDPTLTLEQRLYALDVVTMFDIQFYGRELISAIELQDTRSVVFQPLGYGRFPVVTIFAGCGTSGVKYVVEALATETSSERRQLMYDVLEQGAGLDYLENKLMTAIEKNEMSEGQSVKLTQALAEIKERQRRFTGATPQSTE